jgi:phosphoenolpyruvate-protein kinase (PTS system EI component)
MKRADSETLRLCALDYSRRRLEPIREFAKKYLVSTANALFVAYSLLPTDQQLQAGHGTEISQLAKNAKISEAAVCTMIRTDLQRLMDEEIDG